MSNLCFFWNESMNQGFEDSMNHQWIINELSMNHQFTPDHPDLQCGLRRNHRRQGINGLKFSFQHQPGERSKNCAWNSGRWASQLSAVLPDNTHVVGVWKYGYGMHYVNGFEDMGTWMKYLDDLLCLQPDWLVVSTAFSFPFLSQLTVIPIIHVGPNFIQDGLEPASRGAWGLVVVFSSSHGQRTWSSSRCPMQARRLVRGGNNLWRGMAIL